MPTLGDHLKMQTRTLQRVLIGIDGSAESLAAAEWLASLEPVLGSIEVTAVAAYGADAVATLPVYVFTDDFWREWRDSLQKDLDGAWTKPLRDAGFKVSALVVEGTPEEVMLRLAGEQQADLIVVGSRGRGHVRGILLGSVSHALAIHAHCPVVIFPHRHDS